MQLNNKPNFKVEHPYSNFIKSIIVGLIILLTSIFSFAMVNMINSTAKEEVKADVTFTYSGGTWGDLYGTSFTIAGSGTAASPYIITEWNHFIWLYNYQNNRKNI